VFIQNLSLLYFVHYDCKIVRYYTTINGYLIYPNQHDVISDVIVRIAGQNITPLLVSVELFENNITAYHTRILFF